MSRRRADPELPRGVALAWGVAAHPQRGPKRELSIERIVEAAIEIADAEGLGAVSMSRVATSLGFTTMSLYRYVTSKDDLILLMQEERAAACPCPTRPSSAAGATASRAWVLAMRARTGRIRGSSTSRSRVRRSRPTACTIVDWFLREMRDLPLSDGEKMSALLLVTSYVRATSAQERDIGAAAAASDPADVTGENAFERARRARHARALPVPQPLLVGGGYVAEPGAGSPTRPTTTSSSACSASSTASSTTSAASMPDGRPGAPRAAGAQLALPRDKQVREAAKARREAEKALREAQKREREAIKRALERERHDREQQERERGERERATGSGANAIGSDSNANANGSTAPSEGGADAAAQRSAVVARSRAVRSRWCATARQPSAASSAAIGGRLLLAVLDHEHAARVQQRERPPRERAHHVEAVGAAVERATGIVQLHLGVARDRVPRARRAGSTPRRRPVPSSSGSASARSAKTSSRLSAPTSSTLRRVHGNASGEFSTAHTRACGTSVARARAIAPLPVPRSTRSARARPWRAARRWRSARPARSRGAARTRRARPRARASGTRARPVRCCSGSRAARRATSAVELRGSASSSSPPTTIRACTPPRERPSTCPMQQLRIDLGVGHAGRRETCHRPVAHGSQVAGAAAASFIHEMECNARDRTRAPP